MPLCCIMGMRYRVISLMERDTVPWKGVVFLADRKGAVGCADRSEGRGVLQDSRCAVQPSL